MKQKLRDKVETARSVMGNAKQLFKSAQEVDLTSSSADLAHKFRATRDVAAISVALMGSVLFGTMLLSGGLFGLSQLALVAQSLTDVMFSAAYSLSWLVVPVAGLCTVKPFVEYKLAVKRELKEASLLENEAVKAETPIETVIGEAVIGESESRVVTPGVEAKNSEAEFVCLTSAECAIEATEPASPKETSEKSETATSRPALNM